MAHPELERHFPLRPISSDPYLRTTLNRWEYCEGRADLAEARAELDAELSAPDMVERLYQALEDDDECLRVGAASRIVAAGLPEAEAVALRFLNAPDVYDRMTIAELCQRFESEAIAEKIIQLITSDPAPEVRGQACWSLLGWEPARVIPLLLQVIETDHECDDEVPAPSGVAATVLDHFLGTQYMAIRLESGFSTFRPGGPDLDALKQHARQVLRDQDFPRA